MNSSGGQGAEIYSVDEGESQLKVDLVNRLFLISGKNCDGPRARENSQNT